MHRRPFLRLGAVVRVARDLERAPILPVLDPELAGPAFDPSGQRLHVSARRGDKVGITYEICGPFAVGRHGSPRRRHFLRGERR